MDIIKFSEYLLNEARIEKQVIIHDLVDLFTKKPLIKTNKKSNISSSAMADEKGMYSLGTLKDKFKDKYTSIQISNALHEMINDKEYGLKSIAVRHSLWKENLPYYYIKLNAQEAKDLKFKYEKQEADANKSELERRSKSKSTSSTKPAKKNISKKVPKKSPKK